MNATTKMFVNFAGLSGGTPMFSRVLDEVFQYLANNWESTLSDLESIATKAAFHHDNGPDTEASNKQLKKVDALCLCAKQAAQAKNLDLVKEKVKEAQKEFHIFLQIIEG